ncbi:MAG: inositol monophosphatase [Phycisphaerae bacterium]|nr:inositol monophosphatase [Phycisphaerae bacterium]
MSIHHTELSRMLEAAVVAARLAGQRAMEELRYVKKDIKNSNEMVTQADSICQKLIIDRIRESFPDHGFIAEEGADGAFFRIVPRGGEPIWWVIDPIDGTNNFANGLLCFSVSIAAMVEGKPIVGVIFDPTTDSMYTAAEDMDAQLNGSRITVSEDDIGPFASFGVDSHEDPQVDAAKQIIMAQTRYRCLGSTALHMAYVAKGAMIGMVTVGAKLWDIAAGAILIERAGGVIMNLEGNCPFPLAIDTYHAELIQVLATSKKVHKQVHDIFAEK